MAAIVHKGSCTCGAIKIEAQGEPMVTALCHCLNCQKATGSTYSTNWVMPQSGFKIISGEPATYDVQGASGNFSHRKFCGTCSSTMWTESASFPGIVVIKAGIIDDGGLGKYPPTNETFTSRKPGWLKAMENAKQFEEAYHA